MRVLVSWLTGNPQSKDLSLPPCMNKIAMKDTLCGRQTNPWQQFSL
ncbi:MAG: hypothetical protein PHI13_11470 [Methylococcales bacterium]|nr:hypothetical protein [Methylococcales bacterium]